MPPLLLPHIPPTPTHPHPHTLQVTREVFEASKGRLKVVGRAGVGIDNVDLAAASEVGCLVVNAPTANTVAAAEHGIALLCALARNVPQADSAMKGGRWERNKWVGVSMVGKTLAIMGFGKVGSEVARRAKGLGMTVLAYDPYASAEKAAAMGVTIVSFEDALAKVSAIGCCIGSCISTAATRWWQLWVQRETGQSLLWRSQAANQLSAPNRHLPALTCW